MTDICNFTVNELTYKYTLRMSVDILVNTLQVSSDSGNVCLDIHQGYSQSMLCHFNHLSRSFYDCWVCHQEHVQTREVKVVQSSLNK